MITSESHAQETFDVAEWEIEVLRREVADLASALNGLRHDSRGIRAFNLYRRIRYRITEGLLRLPWWRTRLQSSATYRGPNTPPYSATGSTNHSYDVVFMSSANWQWRYQRPQHLANEWAEHGHRVFFLSPDFRSHVNPAYLRPKRPYTVCSVRPGVLEVHLAGPRELRPLTKRMIAHDTKELVTACQALRKDFYIERGVCVVEFPFWTPLALALREQFGWKTIYDLVDRWYGVFPRSHSTLAEEMVILREADLVVVTARLLQDDVKAMNSKICLIPNAADVEHFTQGTLDDSPDNLDVRKPTVGYFGNLAPWFDVELVLTTAKHRPDWTFVLIGSGTADTGDLSRLSNVKLLGEIPYQALPAYLNVFDVCIIPFRALPVTAATDPVKFYEYLAAGKPVVTTDLPELRPYRDVIYLADTPSAFEQSIALALAEDTEVKRLQRVEFARHHTWSKRFQDFDRAICNLFEVSEAATQPPMRWGDASQQVPGPPSPLILELEPSAIRINCGFRWPGESFGELCIRGRSLTPDCVALVDEQTVTTRFRSSTEMHCQVPASLYRTPGCLMVSVMDQNTWKQSNRRVLLVEGV